jgi:excisionase family DNA binding protein
MDAEKPELLTVGQAAKVLQISRAGAYAHAAAGHLPTVRVGPRSIRVPRAALAKWIETRTRGGDEVA